MIFPRSNFEVVKKQKQKQKKTFVKDTVQPFKPLGPCHDMLRFDVFFPLTLV